MNTFLKFINYLNVKRVLTIFLAGFLLVISTACSDGNIAQAGGKAYTDTAKRAMSDTYDKYDANQEFQGGMNGYHDDTRYDSKTASKAKALKDSAASNSRVESFDEYADAVRQGTKEAKENLTTEIPSQIEGNLADAKQDIENRTEQLKNNLERVPEATKQAFNEATNTAKNALEDADRASKKTVREVRDNFEDLT